MEARSHDRERGVRRPGTGTRFHTRPRTSIPWRGPWDVRVPFAASPRDVQRSRSSLTYPGASACARYALAPSRQHSAVAGIGDQAGEAPAEPRRILWLRRCSRCDASPARRWSARLPTAARAGSMRIVLPSRKSPMGRLRPPPARHARYTDRECPGEATIGEQRRGGTQL